MKLKLIYIIFYLFFILGINGVAAESIITINVSESGDAFWTMEKFIHFSKESDFNEWVTMGQNLSRYRNVPEYDDMIKSFQNWSLNFSNRSMEIQTFNITYDTRKTLSEELGIIRYTFLWKNFSYTDSKGIRIGDALPDNVLLLSADSQLIIRIPEGYEVTTSMPVYDKRNQNLLIWDGTLYSNFSRGGPFLILSPIVPSHEMNTTNLQHLNGLNSTTWTIAAIAIFLLVIMVSIAFIRLWKKMHSENISTAKIKFYEEMVTQVPKEMLNELSEIPSVWAKIVQSVQNEFGKESVEELEKAAREQRLRNMGLDSSIPLSELDKEDLEDEEMIKQFILRSGGQAYQSDIVDHSGLSKSKISMVLSKMKEDGMIIKIRKGKENLIRLVK